MTAITFQLPWESYVRWMISKDRKFSLFFVDYESSVTEPDGILDQLTAINKGWA